MNRIAIRFSLAGLALAVPILAASAFLTTSPAVAAAPVCAPGFSTIQSTSWLLKCRKIVSGGLLQLTTLQAKKAKCKTDSYWNFGPSVSVQKYLAGGFQWSVTYTCGHVEG